MSSQEIDRFQVALVANGSDLTIILASGNTCVAKTSINKRSKRIQLADASGIQMPTNFSLLGDDDIDLSLYCGKALTAGNDPAVNILDAAYQHIQMNQARLYDQPSVETDEFEIVLNASSSIPLGDAPASSSLSRAGGRTKPRRRKNSHHVWI